MLNRCEQSARMEPMTQFGEILQRLRQTLNDLRRGGSAANLSQPYPSSAIEQKFGPERWAGTLTFGGRTLPGAWCRVRDSRGHCGYRGGSRCLYFEGFARPSRPGAALDLHIGATS